jgi:hypothetical protein
MKATHRAIFISAITTVGLMLSSCSNNDNASAEKRRADSIDSVNKVLQGINAENTNNANEHATVQDKTQLAASLKVINDDISVCDANITSGTAAITLNTAKKMNKNLSQAERDESSEKLAAAVVLVKVNTEKKGELEKQRDALQKQMDK